MNTLLGKHWHHLPVNEVLDLLDSDIRIPEGLHPAYIIITRSARGIRSHTQYTKEEGAGK